jgi:hypothetical protein
MDAWISSVSAHCTVLVPDPLHKEFLLEKNTAQGVLQGKCQQFLIFLKHIFIEPNL